MKRIKSILLFFILLTTSSGIFANELYINQLREMSPKCNAINYKHNCFLDYKRENYFREVGFWKNNNLWEGYYFEDNHLIYSYKKGKVKSMSSCKKKGDWNYCPGGRKFQILDKDKNIMKIIYSDGSSYEGIIKDRLKHGTGLFKWKNGDFYNGNWENDNLNGIGTFNFASGDKYIGNYVDGLRHGYGNYTYADGTVLEGIFEKGKFKHKKTKPISISNSKIEEYKSFCSEIGFTPGTEKFGDCVVEAMKKG